MGRILVLVPVTAAEADDREFVYIEMGLSVPLLPPLFFFPVHFSGFWFLWLLSSYAWALHSIITIRTIVIILWGAPGPLIALSQLEQL